MMSIVAKQVGQNVNIVFDNDSTLSKRFVEKSERDAVLVKCKEYHAKPTEKLKEEIVQAMNVVKIKEKKKKQEIVEKIAKIKQEIAEVKDKKLVFSDIVLENLSEEDRENLAEKLKELKNKKEPQQRKSEYGGKSRKNEYR